MTMVIGQELAGVSMEEAVGYPAIRCEHQTPVEHALVFKHNRYFLITDPHGDIFPPGQCALGLFHDDTRILSHYALRLRGGPPSLLSSQVLRTYRGQVNLAVGDQEFGGSSWDPKNCIHIQREFFLADRLIERITLTNYLTVPVDYWMELSAGCDFADIFEVRGWRREKRGQFFAPRVNGDGTDLVFSYQGTDGQLIESSLTFIVRPTRLDGRGARWEFRLEPNECFQTEWEIMAGTRGSGNTMVAPFQLEERQGRMKATYQNWAAQCTHWSTDVADFNGALHRAVDDLRALYVEAGGAQVISAGIPWYSTAFGRDSIITSLQTLALNSRLAVDTLRYLASMQGAKEDPYTEEQPGKILHELRRGELARSGEIPHLPYYGTIDATPLWLILLHETWRWRGDQQLVRELLPNARRALEWIKRHGDLDGDGFIEYARSSKKGLVNQGWKDSGDGVPFPDGRLAAGPIALVEVQGYVYDAKMRMAELFEHCGHPEEGEILRKEAEQLRASILRHFWMEEAGTFALALDGEKNQVKSITSNAGHLLWSRVPTESQAERMVKVLLGPEMFSGWGIRTLSAAHPVFNPMSYHNGSVWPHDNALILMGLCSYSHSKAALPVISGLREAALNEFQRLPELFCGMRRFEGMRPVLYPVSCSPQAWASGALFMLLQGVLGILPEASAQVLHIRNPVIPSFLDEVTLSSLKVGNSKVALQFRRHGRRTLANLLKVEGEDLQVRIELY